MCGGRAKSFSNIEIDRIDICLRIQIGTGRPVLAGVIISLYLSGSSSSSSTTVTGGYASGAMPSTASRTMRYVSAVLASISAREHGSFVEFFTMFVPSLSF
jgi:hypothetical protein